MAKTIRFLLKLFFFIVILFALTVIVITNFVDPNDYKPTINSLVRKHTGKELQLTGNLTWTFYPTIGIAAEKAEFKDSPEAKETLFTLIDPKIYLNLSDIFSKHLTLSGIHVNSKLILPNQKPYSSIYIDAKVNLGFGGSTLSITPLTISTNSTKIIANIHVNNKDNTNVINGDLSIPEFNIANLIHELNITTDNSQGPLPNMCKFKTDFILKDKNNLEISNIDLHLGTGNLTGKIALLNSNNKYKGNFNFIAHDLNIDELLVIGNSLANLTPHHSSTNNQTTANAPKAESATQEQEDKYLVSLLRSLDLTGTIVAKNTLITKSIKVTNFDVNVATQDNKLSLTPITASIYNSEHNASIILNTATPTSTLKVVDKAENFEINDVLSGLGYPNKIKGNAKLNLSAFSSGLNINSLKQNLNGNLILDINQGAVYGIDLIEMLSYAENSLNNLFKMVKADNKLDLTALIPQQAQDFKQNIGSDASTPFNKIYAATTIKGNIIHNSKFTITHDQYEINGTGEINLETNAIQYNLSATLRKPTHTASEQEVIDYMLKTPIPITISGTLENPIIKPDLNKYMQSAAQGLQSLLLKEVVKKIIPGDTGNNLQDTLQGIFKNF